MSRSPQNLFQPSLNSYHILSIKNYLRRIEFCNNFQFTPVPKRVHVKQLQDFQFSTSTPTENISTSNFTFLIPNPYLIHTNFTIFSISKLIRVKFYNIPNLRSIIPEQYLSQSTHVQSPSHVPTRFESINVFSS